MCVSCTCRCRRPSSSKAAMVCLGRCADQRAGDRQARSNDVVASHSASKRLWSVLSFLCDCRSYPLFPVLPIASGYTIVEDIAFSPIQQDDPNKYKCELEGREMSANDACKGRGRQESIAGVGSEVVSRAHGVCLI